MEELMKTIVHAGIPLFAKCHVASQYTLDDVLRTMKTLRDLALEDNSDEGGEFYDELVEQLKPVLQDKIRTYVKGYAERENTSAEVAQVWSSVFEMGSAMAAASQAAGEPTPGSSPNPFEDGPEQEDIVLGTCGPDGCCPCESNEDILDEVLNSLAGPEHPVVEEDSEDPVVEKDSEDPVVEEDSEEPDVEEETEERPAIMEPETVTETE